MGDGSTTSFPEWEQARLRARPEDGTQRQMVAWLELPIGSAEIGRLAARKRALQELIDTASAPTALRLHQRLSDPRDALGQFLRLELSQALRQDLVNRLGARVRADSRSTDVSQRGTPTLRHEPLWQRSKGPTAGSPPSLQHEPLWQRSTDPSARSTKDSKPYVAPLMVPVECLATPQYYPHGLVPYAVDRPVWLVPAPCPKPPKPPICVLLPWCEDEKTRKEREERERREREEKERKAREREERDRKERERQERERQERERKEREKAERERKQREKKAKERQAEQKTDKKETDKDQKARQDNEAPEDKDISDPEAVDWLNAQMKKPVVAAAVGLLVMVFTPELVAVSLLTLARQLLAGKTVARAGELAARRIFQRVLRLQGIGPTRVFDLNKLRKNFPGLDLISPDRGWQVKMWGVNTPSKPKIEVARSVVLNIRELYGYQSTRWHKNCVNTLIKSKDAIEAKTMGAWPTRLGNNPTFEDGAAFLQRTAYAVPKDLVPLVRSDLGKEVVSNPKFREMIPELRLGSEIEISSLDRAAQKAWAEKASTFVHTRVVSIEVTTDQLRQMQDLAKAIRDDELLSKHLVP